MAGGVSKSGSPTLSRMTSLPWRLSWDARKWISHAAAPSPPMRSTKEEKRMVCRDLQKRGVDRMDRLGLDSRRCAGGQSPAWMKTAGLRYPAAFHLQTDLER